MTVYVSKPFRMASKEADDHYHKAYRAIVLEYYKRITMKTPRKTGRAAGNWQIAINAQPAGEISATLPIKGTISATQTGKLSKARVKNFPTVTISNALPYILPLEYGSSIQARTPAGMVRVTMIELKGWAAK